MGTTDNLFSMDPNTANNLLNFGFSTMANSQTPGISTLAALGKGGEGMNAAALQRSQMQNLGQEAAGKTLNNAMQLRQLNLGNIGMGMNPVTMPGVPDLLNQGQQNTPAASAGQPWSASAGGNVPTATRTALSNSGSSQTTVPPIFANAGITSGAMDVALQKRMPQTSDEAIQAAKVANFMGNTDWGKQLSSTAIEGAKPYDLRPGGSHINPLGSTTVNPAHIQNAEGMTVPFSPEPTTYPANNNSGSQGAGGRNAGGGIAQPGIKTGYSPTEKSAQESYLGPETVAYNGAQNAMQNLELMQHSIDTLNSKPGLFSTGSSGTSRIQFGKAANTFLTTIGAPTLDEDKIAEGESLFKTTGRLGFNMSKQLGAREPGVITEQAIALNPGMDNTPKGIQLLKNSIQEEQQRIIDEHNFKGQYYNQQGFNQQGAEAAFDSQYTPKLYAQRATSQLDPIQVNTVGAAKGFLAGTRIKTPQGIKIVPPTMGIAPPAYSRVSPKQPIQASQEEPE